MSIWQGELVRLRAVEPKDWELFYELECDTLTSGLVHDALGTPRSPQVMQKEFEEAAAKRIDGHTFKLVIENDQAQAVGWICSHGCNSRQGVFRYGICMHSGHRRKGYAREAVILFLRYFFEELRYQKCNAGVYEYQRRLAAIPREPGLHQGRPDPPQLLQRGATLGLDALRDDRRGVSPAARRGVSCSGRLPATEAQRFTKIRSEGQ